MLKNGVVIITPAPNTEFALLQPVCLNDVTVNLMHRLRCLQPVTWTTSEYDVSTSVLFFVCMI